MSNKSASKGRALGECRVADMMSDRVIEYPVTDFRLRYDFHFSKDGSWYYVNSFNDINHTVWEAQARTVEERGESWRIIDVKRNTIVKSEYSDMIVQCALCDKRIWFRDSWSPGDDCTCSECDTEVTGRKHPRTLNVKTQPPPRLVPRK